MNRGFLVTVRLVPCVLLVLAMGSCKKKPPPAIAVPDAPAVVAPSKPAAVMPTIEITAEPSTIERGSQTTLSWKSTDATSVLIDGGVGNVAETGSLVLSPTESTTYTAIARGSGGSARDSTRVTVVPKRAAKLSVTDIEGLQRAIDDGRVRPVFFDYDRALLSSKTTQILEENARWIKRFPTATVIVEGHCDERGSEEYNLALGDRRAQVTRDYLLDAGVSATQLEALSFGEERPFESCHDETCWSKNRRAHFAVKR